MIKDAEVIVGNTEGTITLDFSELEDSDAKG
jgi:hypothetical protein